MHEGGASFGGDHFVRSQPAAILAARAERIHIFQKARWVSRQPRLTVYRRLARRRAPFHEPGVVVERTLPARVRVAIGERRVGRRRDVSELVEQVHHLVIAEQGLDTPTGAPCFLFEPHQQVERLSYLGAAIEDVARLDEHGRAAGPLPLGVDHASGLQDLDELVERSVHVADGDHPWPGRFRGGWSTRLHGRDPLGDRDPEGCHQQESGNDK